MAVLSESKTQPQPLSVSRERAQRTGSIDDSEGPRRNLDKRTARLTYAEKFKNQLSLMKPVATPQQKLIGEKVHGVSVYVRKRPIFDYELDRNDFDVVTVNGEHQVIVNSCQMKADMKQKVIKPFSFSCTGVFGADRSSSDIYDEVASPLVTLALSGKLATILSFGQTGSGKTYTMTEIEEKICCDLFRDSSTQVSVQFIELAGKNVIDLLQEGQVKIADQPSGNVRFLNAKTVHVSSPEALSQVIARGKRRRSTEATDRNGVSSRSHAVCQISCVNTKKKQLGVLNLIDLAGSERRGDSLFHCPDRQKESTDTNSSLYALKECIRVKLLGKANNVIPYRSNPLTRILRPTLEQPNSQLNVVATVAPNATDSEHTIETLKTVCSLIGSVPFVGDEVDVPDTFGRLTSPKQFTKADILAFMLDKNLLTTEEVHLVPNSLNGRQVMRMTIMQLKNAIYSDDKDQDRAEKLFRCLRQESDRIRRLELKQRIARKKGSDAAE